MAAAESPRVRESYRPAGETIAFLFTDIVGSTKRWDANREAMQAALRRHDAVVRTAIEAHGGRVFKTIGDAFCASFPRAGDALLAAADAQRRIGQENWDAVNGLRVRMAIHVGESDERDGDYFGPAVNRVARMLSAGHGGQVLVSGSAADAAAPDLRSGMGLRALGMLPLKDLREPERVFQLTAPDLVAEFRPLRALETPPNNLPRVPTSFVGRHADVARVEEGLRTGALVTVVGTGGIGKTRLALAAAAGLLNDTREGAWFVDLAPLSDGALVPSAILTALDADQASDAPALDVLVHHLMPRGLLLVLDNCEHLIVDVARVVAAIVSSCPQVTVLATSREALNITGERVYRLSSLDESEAVNLFCDRAQAVNPTFRLSETNRATVEDLCRRLDGMALAIELAAARIRSVSLDDLSNRLRLRVLVGGPRDRQPRQQTMHALIDWSFDLLAPEEQRLFCAAGVFAGGFTLEAAAGLDGDTHDDWRVLDLLTSLADKSLLVVEAGEGRQRYRLLEPIREYARERLDEAGETPRIAGRFARTFSDIADRAYREWDTAPEPDWLARAECELDNFRAALDWALDDRHDVVLGARMAASLSPMFLRLSLLREGIGWCERALQDASPDLPAEAGARLFYGLSMLQHNQGANEKALASARQAVELYREAGDERGLTRGLSQVAHQLAGREAYVEAQAAADEALRRARALDEPRLLAGTLQRCALVYEPGEIERARLLFAESVALFRRLNRNDETARALSFWADAEIVGGQLQTGATIACEALELAPDELKTYLTNGLATCYLALGERERAGPVAREALTLAVNAHHPVATAYAILYLAAIESDADAASAALLFGYARERMRALEWKLVGPDRDIVDRLTADLERKLSPGELPSLHATGASWSEEQAIAHAARV